MYSGRFDLVITKIVYSVKSGTDKSGEMLAKTLNRLASVVTSSCGLGMLELAGGDRSGGQAKVR